MSLNHELKCLDCPKVAALEARCIDLELTISDEKRLRTQAEAAMRFAQERCRELEEDLLSETKWAAYYLDSYISFRDRADHLAIAADLWAAEAADLSEQMDEILKSHKWEQERADRFEKSYRCIKIKFNMAQGFLKKWKGRHAELRNAYHNRGKALVGLAKMVNAIYCPTCGSCGESGCCPPDMCRTVQGLYCDQNLKEYSDLVCNNDQLRDALSAMYGYLLQSDKDGEAHIPAEIGAMAEAALKEVE